MLNSTMATLDFEFRFAVGYSKNYSSWLMVYVKRLQGLPKQSQFQLDTCRRKFPPNTRLHANI